MVYKTNLWRPSLGPLWPLRAATPRLRLVVFSRRAVRLIYALVSTIRTSRLQPGASCIDLVLDHQLDMSIGGARRVDRATTKIYQRRILRTRPSSGAQDSLLFFAMFRLCVLIISRESNAICVFGAQWTTRSSQILG